MSDDNKVFRLGSVKGGKNDGEDHSIPVNNYVITDIDDDDFFGTGFVIFTAHHLAVMQDSSAGAVPVLVMPINRVKICEIIENSADE